MREKLIFSVVAAVVACSVLSCARAEKPPLKAVPPGDVKNLAGVWNGWIVGPSGKSEQAELTINPDGTYVSRMQGFTTTGVLQVTGSTILADSQTATGGVAVGQRHATMMLGERAGALVLSGQGQSAAGPFSFEVTKRK